MASSQASVAVGLFMVVAGVGLWSVALMAQQQRFESAATTAASCPPVSLVVSAMPSSPPAMVIPRQQDTPTVGSGGAPAGASASASASASAGTSAGTSASASASAAPSASASATAVAGDGVFRFKEGSVELATGEVARLIAYYRDLQKQPRGKILVEGTGDDDTPAGVLLGRRRSLIVRQLLSEVGYDAERLILPPPPGSPIEGLHGVARVTLQEVKAP